MFEGFTTHTITANGVRLHVRLGGDGPPLLLVHGYPQTGAMWHAVAPGLASRFSLVIPDLRGYGQSEAPPAGPDHSEYSKRTMALDLVELMRGLGHERFLVAGHDRGARVVYRMAVDHPDVVAKAATLDIIPTLATWTAMDWHGAIGSFHWQLLAQPSPIPERLIGRDPDFWLRTLLARWAAPGFEFNAEALVEYERAFRRSEVIVGTCEDYRAGATIDAEIDQADCGVRKIQPPLLALWGDRGGRRASLVDVWKEWAADVRGLPVPCGHFIAEEAPAMTLAAFLEFFGEA